MQAKAEDEVMYDAQAEDTDSEEGGDELQNSMQPDPPAKTILGLTYASAFKIGITIILIGGVVLGLTVWDLDERMRSLLEWLEDNKVEGITIFVALYMALTGERLGIQVCCMEGSKRGITEHALKMTILVRLATVIPYSVTNDLLPIRNISFWKYTVGSAIGILPGVCLYVMLGSLAGVIAMASAGEMDETSNPILLFTTVGTSIVILIILIAVLTRYAKKSLAEQGQKVEVGEVEAADEDADVTEPQKDITLRVGGFSSDSVPDEDGG